MEENDVKLKELAQTASEKAGVDPQATNKVLKATFSLLGEKLKKGEKVRLPGLGTFVHKPGKEPGQSGRTLFRPWSAEASNAKPDKQDRAAKRAARKQAKQAES